MPERRDREPRGCLPTFAIGLLMFAIVGAGVAASDALSERPAVPVVIGAGVSIRPPLSWSFVSRFEAPTGEEDSVLLTRGVGSLLAYTSDASVEAELDELRRQLSTSSLVSLGQTEAVDVHPGRNGWRFAFSGALPELAAVPVEGEVVAIVGSSVVLVSVSWSDVGSYELIRPEIDQMLAGATIP
ncbi:MAG TPA: hypothetical protein VM305_07135 [Candidatus Limnocylindrales bacterium]|nr:hypothetical protein [Candidatus Limnocylindrales bacterium]